MTRTIFPGPRLSLFFTTNKILSQTYTRHYFTCERLLRVGQIRLSKKAASISRLDFTLVQDGSFEATYILFSKGSVLDSWLQMHTPLTMQTLYAVWLLCPCYLLYVAVEPPYCVVHPSPARAICLGCGADSKNRLRPRLLLQSGSHYEQQRIAFLQKVNLIDYAPKWV